MKYEAISESLYTIEESDKNINTIFKNPIVINFKSVQSLIGLTIKLDSIIIGFTEIFYSSKSEGAISKSNLLFQVVDNMVFQNINESSIYFEPIDVKRLVIVSEINLKKNKYSIVFNTKSNKTE